VKILYPQGYVLFLAAVENRSIKITHQLDGSPDFYLNTKIHISCAARGYDKIELINVIYNDSMNIYTT